MSALAILNRQGKTAGEVKIPDSIFGQKVNTKVLHQAVLMYQARQRQGTASTKERADVSGGGIKPYRQKGTGRARVGSIRSPLFIGGGVTFGPHPRDFGYKVPQKVKQAALRESLNAKFQSKNLHCIEELTQTFNKTKEFATILKALKLTGKTLAVLDGSDPSIRKVSRNLPRFHSVPAAEVNAYDILRNKNMIITQTALKTIMKRLGKNL